MGGLSESIQVINDPILNLVVPLINDMSMHFIPKQVYSDTY